MLLGNLFYFNNKIHQKKIIKGISFDSRNVKKGDVFFAIEGKKTSGIKFIKEAIQRGASAVVTEKKLGVFKICGIIGCKLKRFIIMKR